MEFQFLGRGGAFNRKEGATSAYKKIGTELFVIDFGEDVFDKLLKYNLFDEISRVNIFITHLHGDHVGSLGTALFYIYFYVFHGDKSRVNVYFPSDSLKNLLRMQGITEDVYTYYINKWDELLPDGQDNKLEYEFYETPHAEELKRNGHYDSYAVSFNLKNKGSVFYSGDTNIMLDEVKKGFAYDIIYHEVTKNEKTNAHYQWKQLLEDTKGWTREEKGRVYLMHLDKDMTEEEAKEQGFQLVKLAENKNRF